MDLSIDFDSFRWYLVKTKPREEERVLGYLKFANYSFLFPTFWKTVLFGKKREKKPLFPGYVFTCLRLKQDYHKIRYTRGVAGFVRFGGGLPIPVKDEIIETLKSRTREDGTIKMVPKPLEKGDVVKIAEGPFAGFEAIFIESLNDGERVALLLKGLNSARVEISRLYVSTVI
jgi:transcriptional antiterminator RfaH